MIHIIVDKPEQINGCSKSLFIYYNISLKEVSCIRKVTPRYYNDEKREWELPHGKLKQLIEILEKEKIEYVIEDLTENKEINFDFKTKPFDHQNEFYELALPRSRVLLGDDQGLGKTKQAIDISCMKKQTMGFQHCLVVVGVNGLKSTWEEQIEIHSHEKGIILGQRMITRGWNLGCFRDGSIEERIEDLLKIPEEYFWIINVESLRDERLRTILQRYCQKNIISMCIADEIHKMKNPVSKQGRGFLKLQTKDRLALTGTPLINSPLDTFIILKWLEAECHTWTEFKNYHCIFGGYGNHIVTGYRHLHEIKNKLESVMIRRCKEDVLDLPEKMHAIEYITMGDKQSSIYKEIKTAMLQEIDQIKLHPNPLAQLTRLRQATAHTSLLSSQVSESCKFNRMLQLVENSVENGEKVVIFSQFKDIVDEAKRALEKYFPAVITGDVRDRQVEINKFQNDEKCRVIIGTTGAMGTGYTLTAASTMIFLDEPWSKALKLQAEDRIHRIGTKGTVNIITLICKNTIDEKINLLVEKKGEMSDMLVDGKLVGNKSEIVDWLLL